MRLTILLLFILSAIVCSAQFSITTSGNISIIKGQSKFVNPNPGSSDVGFSVIFPSYSIRESFESRGGYAVGIAYTQAITSKFELRGGVEYQSVAFRRNRDLIYPDGLSNGGGGTTIIGSPFGEGFYYGDVQEIQPGVSAENVGETRLSYVVIPISTFYKLTTKLRLGIGLRHSFLVVSKETELRYVYNNLSDIGSSSEPLTVTPAGQIIEYDDTSGEGLRTFNLTGSVYLLYQVLNKLEVISSFDQGFSGLYKTKILQQEKNA